MNIWADVVFAGSVFLWIAHHKRWIDLGFFLFLFAVMLAAIFKLFKRGK